MNSILNETNANLEMWYKIFLKKFHFRNCSRFVHLRCSSSFGPWGEGGAGWGWRGKFDMNETGAPLAVPPSLGRDGSESKPGVGPSGAGTGKTGANPNITTGMKTLTEPT